MSRIFSLKPPPVVNRRASIETSEVFQPNPQPLQQKPQIARKPVLDPRAPSLVQLGENTRRPGLKVARSQSVSSPAVARPSWDKENTARRAPPPPPTSKS